jgi:hypothetical protein
LSRPSSAPEVAARPVTRGPDKSGPYTHNLYVSRLAAVHKVFHNSAVRQRVEEVTELPLRPQEETECRRCEVHCDKVVYPAACLSVACPFLYAYEEWGHTYIGCMQNVYDVEIDLDVLRSAEGTKPGFGAVRATRQPLPMCRAEISSCYENRETGLGCVNPEFSELPQGSSSFRVIASGTLTT